MRDGWLNAEEDRIGRTMSKTEPGPWTEIKIANPSDRAVAFASLRAALDTVPGGHGVESAIVDMLEADAQALADVRTLDEWADAQGWDDTPRPRMTAKGWHVPLGVGGIEPTFGKTRDAARHAAAEWVRGQAHEAMVRTSNEAAREWKPASAGDYPHSDDSRVFPKRGTP